MPEKETLERASADKEEGKAPSTQAGEFVREMLDRVSKHVGLLGVDRRRRDELVLQAGSEADSECLQLG